MKLLLVVIALATVPVYEVGAVLKDGHYNPFIPGDLPVNHTSFLSPLTLFLDTNLDVYAPNAPGAYPLFYLITGLGGIVPSGFDSELLSLIASHGFVVVGVWQLDNPINSFNASWLDATVTFVEKHLEKNLKNGDYDPHFYIDHHNSFIGGHSAGCHVPVAQLQAHCLNFRGQILLSPVDGADPLGYIPIAVITPGEKVNYTIPTLQMVVGLDPVPGPSSIACAPEELSGYRFFDAMNGPTWFINASAFAHNDILNEWFGEMMEWTQLCVTDDQVDRQPYRRFVAGSIVSFMRAIIDPVDSCYLLDYLESSRHEGIQTENDFEANGWQRCTPTQCVLHR